MVNEGAQVEVAGCERKQGKSQAERNIGTEQ